MKIIKAFFNFFRPRSIKELEYDWLAESQDLVELERRQKLLWNGHKTMVSVNPNLRGWV